MSRLEGGLHGLKAYPSARSDDQDFRHGVMLLVGLAWLIVMCNAGSRTARRAGRLHMKGRGRECAEVPTTRRGAAVAASVASGAAVRGRTHDRLGADITASARPVLDDKLLTEPFRQELAHQTRDDVIPAASGSHNDHAHRPRRIGLRLRRARHRRQRGSAGGQMQKISAGKFHFDPSLVKGSDEHFCTPVTYVTGSIALCELPSLRSHPFGADSTP